MPAYDDKILAFVDILGWSYLLEKSHKDDTLLRSVDSVAEAVAEINLPAVKRNGEKTMVHNPPHPGNIIREEYLGPLGVTVTDAAKALGISRKSLSAILNGRAGVSPEMAIRLSIALNTSPESWLNRQMQFDLWQAEEKRGSLKVERIKGSGPGPKGEGN